MNLDSVLDHKLATKKLGQNPAILMSHLINNPYMPVFSQHDATVLARVVQKVDNAIHRITHYPADSVVGFVNIYPLDRDLSGG